MGKSISWLEHLTEDFKTILITWCKAKTQCKVKAVHTFWKGNFSPNQKLWTCTRMTELPSANHGLFMVPSFHSQSSKTTWLSFRCACPPFCTVMMTYKEVCLTLAFFCQLQNIGADSVAPKITTANSSTVLPATSASAELVAPAKHDGTWVLIMVFEGNISIWFGHWIVKAAEMWEETGSSGHCHVCAMWILKDTEAVKGKLWAKPVRRQKLELTCIQTRIQTKLQMQ